MLDMADRVGRRDRHAADGVDDFGRHAYFTYCCGLASNFVLQIFAQK